MVQVLPFLQWNGSTFADLNRKVRHGISSLWLKGYEFQEVKLNCQNQLASLLLSVCST